jgi:hypothetical protein
VRKLVVVGADLAKPAQQPRQDQRIGNRRG